MTIRRLHGFLAIGLGLFLALHLGNHLVGLWGQEAHQATQGQLRAVYRNPLVEPLLLAGFAAQIAFGVALIARRRHLSLQSASGGYLALFLAVHLGAVLAARWQGTDTSLAFAAAGLHAPMPWPLVFAAYYGLAVLAVFVHVSVPVGRRWGIWASRLVLGCGAGLALTLVLLLGGRIVPLVIPPALIAAFP